MSEETKKQAQNTEFYLRQAEADLDEAARMAPGTKDKQLVEKVIKIRESVQKTRQEINEKIGNKNG